MIEIDFVCNKGSNRYYIQSAYSLTDEEKIKQEMGKNETCNTENG